MSQMNKLKLILIAIVLLVLSLAGTKLYNANNALDVYNKCYVTADAGAVFQVVGYKQDLLALQGDYYIIGLIIFIPFEEVIPQLELESWIDEELAIEIPCGNEEKEDDNGQDTK